MISRIRKYFSWSSPLQSIHRRYPDLFQDQILNAIVKNPNCYFGRLHIIEWRRSPISPFSLPYFTKTNCSCQEKDLPAICFPTNEHARTDRQVYSAGQSLWGDLRCSHRLPGPESRSDGIRFHTDCGHSDYPCRKFFRTTILENNIIQTTGSAGESIAAGGILPGFFPCHHPTAHPYFTTLRSSSWRS